MDKHTAAEDMREDLLERAHHLAICVFKSSSKADYERQRHNAAVLSNDIDRWKQNERNKRALTPVHTVGGGDDSSPVLDALTLADTIINRLPANGEHWSLIQRYGAARSAVDAISPPRTGRESK
jgi:hypothetical protein